MNNKELFKKLKNKIAGAYYMPYSFCRSEGCIIKDIENNEYIDLSSGYGVANIGWQNKEMLNHQKKILEKCNYAHPWLVTEESYNLAEKLTSFFPNEEYKCLRTTGGANGNEVAISIFYNKTRGNIATFERSYHGWSQATLGMGEINKYRMPNVKKRYICKKIKITDSLQDVESFFINNKDIKIFIAEPILGSGGVLIPNKNYWKDFKKISDTHGVYLIFDECITGFGRTGEMIASHHYGINPDAIILGKGISSGYAAIGAVMVKKEHLKDYRFGDVSATFAWTPYACEIVLKNIEIIEKNNLCEHANRIGSMFYTKIYDILLNLIKNKEEFNIRQIGAMIAIQFLDSNKKPNVYLHGRLIYKLMEQGVITCSSGDNDSIILLPPLIIDNNTALKAIEKIKNVFENRFKS